MDRERYQVVLAWLTSLYGYRDRIPRFEANPQTIDFLYQLALKNQKHDQQLQVVNQDLKERINARKEEGKKLGALLSSIGFGETSTKEDSSLYPVIHALASIAVQLELVDTELTTYLIGITDHTKEIAQTEIRIGEEKKAALILQEKTRSAQTNLQSLQRVQQEFEQMKIRQKKLIDTRVQQINHFEGKEREYEALMEESKDVLEGNYVSGDLHHRALVEYADKIEQLKKSAESKLSVLNSYNELPPDLALARIKVQEARQELNRLEEQLSKSIHQFI